MSDMQVEVTRDYAFAAETVWGVLADFGDLSWADNPSTEVIGSGPGMIRRIRMPGLAPIDEVLDAIDHPARELSYSIPRGLPMPVRDYAAHIRVESLAPDACRVRWSATATPIGVSAEDAGKIIEGAYGQMLVWLEERLQQS
jgi:hypothetical protein